MSSTTETRTVVEQIVDNADERELWIVGREFERPPYFHAGKGGDTRLARALRVCVEGRITPNSDGSYTVEGSEKRTYRCAESCSCPHSQQSKSKWCYHMVSVALYVEWQRRLRGSAPVALGTLRAGTLPLPPVSVDERLVQSATPEAVWRDVTQEELMADEDEVSQIAAQLRDKEAPIMPQEDAMTEDAEHYIPEPQDAPMTVLEPPAPSPGVTRPLPGPVLLPALDARNLEQSMQAWSDQRKVVRRFLQQELVEGTDYYTLRIKGRETKPALSKAGSEKFMALFQLHATFEQDTATWTMLGQPQGTLCYVCTLHTRGGEIVGEGRGARTIQQDGGDINKAVKMASKSAMVDAVLRTGALSDVFTQDEESIPGATVEPAKAETPAKPTSQDLRQRIWGRMKELYPAVHSREDAEEWIQSRTGMDLHPDNYGKILASLTKETS